KLEEDIIVVVVVAGELKLLSKKEDEFSKDKLLEFLEEAEDTILINRRLKINEKLWTLTS
ncbi:hypothetical protein HAX54_038008, partial [Datura stramonium]|nr:hypothetical protein [Datura stramonium]